MQKVNYVKLYIVAYNCIYRDGRLNSTHVSLYFALLHFYNLSHFAHTFTVARAQLKAQSKIKSDTTYSKAIASLKELGYINYIRSHSPHVASSFAILIPSLDFVTDDTRITLPVNGPVAETTHPKIGTVPLPTLPENGQVPITTSSENGPLVYTSKTYKQKLKTKNETKKSTFKNPSLEEVKEFFKKIKESITEAEKFYNHYESTGWKLKGGTPIENWQARAKIWLTRSAEFARKNKNYLSSEEEKDYNASF